jgi:hypothetical protein
MSCRVDPYITVAFAEVVSPKKIRNYRSLLADKGSKETRSRRGAGPSSG